MQPYDQPVTPEQFIARLAERHGLRPPEGGPMRVLDPRQMRCARDFLDHRAAGPDTPEWDQETNARASAMLRAGRDAPYLQRAMGMTEETLGSWEQGEGSAR